ncbi:hypothetical protein E3E31_06555 [Thermococcus sp. M39]|uniref:hypothetical protein n=1 Tax=unclassified Thermococcus TaxID=2627626 RepID=UPI001438B8BC|nr:MULTISPECIES: hypothetical protein [unclassified Thermococcus]NJE08183.1 hypothetical protein [Thermococcus sp. M39]NJE11676.1 hypothetical protein [Thermococcus sp. LS2]
MEKGSEILGFYLDMLSGGLYLGSVKGSITAVTEEGEFPIISRTPQPMLDVFCNEDSLIFFGFWRHGKEAEYGYIKIPLNHIEVIEETDEELVLYVFSEKRTQDVKGFVRVNLHAEPATKEKILEAIEFGRT